MEKNKKIEFWMLIGIIASTSIGMTLGYISFFIGKKIEAPIYIIPISFTYVSNVLGLIYGVFRIANKFMPTFRRWRNLQLIVTTMLTVTMFIYWTLLARGRDWGNIVGDIGTGFVHFVAPMLVLFLFYLDTKNKNVYNLRYIDIVYTTIFPVIFITYQQILWYGFGEPIYSVLDTKKHGFLLAYIYILAMGSCIFIVAWILIYSSRKMNDKKNENKIKN